MTEAYSEYFKKELNKLKTIGREFSKENPVLSPMFAEGGEDSDVERLLEGVAFLTAGINRKLDDEFPEFLHNLVQSVCPQYLQPVPSSTMIEFSPQSNLNEVFTIPAGTFLDSDKKEDVPVRFRTSCDVDVFPAVISDVKVREQQSGDASKSRVSITLDFQFNTMNLSQFNLKNLKLGISGNYQNASNLFFLLNHYLEGISLTIPGKEGVFLGKESLIQSSFEEDNALFPFPENVFPSYRVLREFFIFPEKFLNLDIDISSWKERGEGERFSLTFDCVGSPYPLPEINRKTFRLFTVPAVNLFPHEAEPVLTEQKNSEILVQPSSLNKDSYRIFSVEKVTGFERGASKRREFQPFTGFLPGEGDRPVYNLIYRPSMNNEEMDISLSVEYPPSQEMPESEIISMDLICSNGKLAENLLPGDISKPTINSPELVTFTNISHVSASYPPPLDDKLLWNLLSYLSVNFQSFADAENLKSVLNSCIITGGRDKVKEIGNSKKISSISEVILTPGEFIIRGSLYRGKSILIKTDKTRFASHGDMYLLGSVLDYFLGSYASMNTVTQLVFLDEKSGDKIKWPTRLGTRPLL